MIRIQLLAGALAVLAGASPLRAQDLAFRLGAGAAVPVGGAGERRDAGPAAAASVDWRPGPRWSVRVDGEWSLLVAPSATPDHPFPGSDVRSTGASVNLVRRLSGGALAPYLLAGLGSYRLQAVGQSGTPYGRTLAVQAGVGIESSRWARVNPFAEARAMVHATDYASDDYGATVYWPVLVGLQVR